MLNFDKNWNRSLLSTERVVEYSLLMDKAQLQVVTEGATDVTTTYFFEVPKKKRCGYPFLKIFYIGELYKFE
jgi:hypothetical protein